MSKDNVRRFTLSFVWFAKWVLAPLILGALLIAGGVALYEQRIDFDTFLNYFALGLLIFVVITLFYGIIAIHDVPYEIAKKRGHPHQDAIHAAGWVSLFTLHALWPFLWIWAMLYRPERGWGFHAWHCSGCECELLRQARRSATTGGAARSTCEAVPNSRRKPERIETRAKHPDLAASAPLEASGKRGAK